MDKLFLSPIDQIFLGKQGYPIEMAFAFDKPLDKQWLSAGLKKLVEAWPFINGVAKVSENEAWIEACPESILGIDEVSYENDLIPDEVRNFHLLSANFSAELGGPLLKLKISHGKKNSWLTVGMAHYLGDGYSYFFLLKNLAKACHGENIDSVRWDRSSILGSEAFSTETPIRVGGKRSENRTDPREGVLLRITKEEAAEWILSAQKEAEKGLSLNDCLCAKIWKESLLKNRPTGLLRLNTMVDFRRYRRADLGFSFFGNAVYVAGLNLSVDEVRSNTIGEIASLIQESVRTTSLEKIGSQIATWKDLIKEVGLANTDCLNLIHPVSPILVTNISSLRLDGIRLHPAGASASAVRYLSGFRGLHVVLPTLENDIIVQHS